VVGMIGRLSPQKAPDVFALPAFAIHPEADGGISILDDSLGIDWMFPTEHANLSEKDTKHQLLKDFESPF